MLFKNEMIFYKMKKIQLLVFFFLLLCMVIFAGCKKDDDTVEKTAEQLQTEKLTKTWVYENVTLEGAAPAEDYTGFRVTFAASSDATNKTYTTVNGQSAWPASGTWSFVGSNLNVIKRNDNIEMTVSNLTVTTLTLTFTIPDTGGRFGERNQGTTGTYVFTLRAQ